MQNIDGYWLFNNAWNAANYSVSQTLYACSPGSWYVTARMNNNSGDGAVKTYPNAHKDFDSNPTITGFSSITSTFAQSGTPSGIYEYAYDIWINGIASSGSTEVMIWTYNHGQSPGGSDTGQQVTISGHSFEVFRGGGYIAFEAKQNFTSGTLDLLQVFKWIISKGWLTSHATLGQVDYGVELVSTDNTPETFAITNYSVSTS